MQSHQQYTRNFWWTISKINANFVKHIGQFLVLLTILIHNWPVAIYVYLPTQGKTDGGSLAVLQLKQFLLRNKKTLQKLMCGKSGPGTHFEYAFQLYKIIGEAKYLFRRKVKAIVFSKIIIV